MHISNRTAIHVRTLVFSVQFNFSLLQRNIRFSILRLKPFTFPACGIKIGRMAFMQILQKQYYV